MQPNGNVIVDTICRTAKLGTTITGATENGDVTVIEAEPVEPINECPTCGQPGVFRDHVIRSLVDLPIVGHPTTSCAPSTLPVHQQALLAEDLPCWPCLRARQFKDHGPGDPLDPATTLPKSDERCRCTQVIRPGVGYEVSQVLFRLRRRGNLEHARPLRQKWAFLCLRSSRNFGSEPVGNEIMIIKADTPGTTPGRLQPGHF